MGRQTPPRAQPDHDKLRPPAHAVDAFAAQRLGANATPGGATAILAMLTVTSAIVLPAIALARPRAIVSTSGSSGNASLGRRHGAQVETGAGLDAGAGRSPAPSSMT